MRRAGLLESEFQRKITDYCDWLGLRWHHETDSRKSKKGFPDLVIVGNAVIFAELKSESGRMSAEQTDWVSDLARGGAETYVWRPADWPYIEKRLKLLAQGI